MGVPAVKAGQIPTLSADLRPEQTAVLLGLLSGHPVTSAARAGGVSRTTVYKWLNEDPAFVAEYRRCREELRVAGRAAVLSLTSQAVRTLRELLRPRVPPAIRLRAAQVVLSAALGGGGVDEATDPADVALELARARRKREVEATRQRHLGPAFGSCRPAGRESDSGEGE